MEIKALDLGHNTRLAEGAQSGRIMTMDKTERQETEAALMGATKPIGAMTRRDLLCVVLLWF